MKIIFAMAAMFISLSVAAETLVEAVQHSMISHPEILYNTAKGLSAKEGIDRAMGAFYPTVDVNAGYGREQSSNPTTQAIDDTGRQTLNRKESSIEIRQNIFSGWGIVNEVNRTQYVYQSQLLKTKGVAEEIALDAVNRYLQVLLHERLLEYAKVNLEAHRSLFTMIKQRSDVGISRQAEMDQANARLALAEANYISSEANLREARINYAKVIGTWPTRLTMPPVPKKTELPKSLPQAIERGLENHPTVKSTYADIKGAKAQHAVARAAYLPRVDVILTGSNNRNLDGLIGPNKDKMAIVRMTYNIFRGGSDDANVRLTAYEVQEAYETKNRSLIELREAIRLSWNAWIASIARLPPLKQHIISSRATRAAYQEQFKVGKRTLLDLLDSQNEYYQSQIEYARGQTEEIYSRYRILNGMGMLLCYLKLRLPLNVINNDVFTSAQTHILLNKEMDRIPYPDNTDRPLLLAQSVRNMETAKLTPAIVHKNTMPPVPTSPLIWYICTGQFQDQAKAVAHANRLRALGFASCVKEIKHIFKVLVGPFEYRGQAGNTMARLKEIAHVQGALVSFKRGRFPLH